MRSNRGSILLLTICLSALVAFGTVAILAMLLVFQSQKLEQMQADSIALDMASRLNSGDRIGELNNVISYSRELVYTARETHGTISRHNPQLAELSEMMLDGARQGAQLVEQERRALRFEILSELDREARARSSCFGIKEVQLPFLHISPPQIESIELGAVRESACNAKAPRSLEELAQFDLNCGYLFKGSKFYRANVDAKLPAPDNDLPFKFSALAPPVEQTLAPARLISRSAFAGSQVAFGHKGIHRVSTDSLPSALELQISMPIRFNKNDEMIRAVSSAATSGGAPAI